MRARAAAGDRRLWMTSASPTCRSIVCSGLSEVIGSWNTMATRLPRTSRMRASPAPSSSSPSKRMDPPGGWAATG